MTSAKSYRAEIADIPISSLSDRKSFQELIEYKASAFLHEQTKSTFNYEVKRIKPVAVDTVLPGGGKRRQYFCPPGTPNGGDFTDRFGRNCGTGLARRLANALTNAGQRLGNLDDRRRAGRQQRRAARQARRAQQGSARQRMGRIAGTGDDAMLRFGPVRFPRNRRPQQGGGGGGAQQRQPQMPGGGGQPAGGGGGAPRRPRPGAMPPPTGPGARTPGGSRVPRPRPGGTADQDSPIGPEIDFDRPSARPKPSPSDDIDPEGNRPFEVRQKPDGTFELVPNPLWHRNSGRRDENGEWEFIPDPKQPEYFGRRIPYMRNPKFKPPRDESDNAAGRTQPTSPSHQESVVQPVGPVTVHHHVLVLQDGKQGNGHHNNETLVIPVRMQVKLRMITSTGCMTSMQ